MCHLQKMAVTAVCVDDMSTWKHVYGKQQKNYFTTCILQYIRAAEGTFSVENRTRSNCVVMQMLHVLDLCYFNADSA